MSVSIVMAVYNNADSVAETMGSVVSQTFQKWELLVVDDASNDGSSEVIDHWARLDSRIRVLKNEFNQGLARSLNIGWRQATYPLIARIDADDTMHPDRLALQSACLDLHSEVDVLGSDIELVDDCGRSLGIAKSIPRHEQIIESIFLRSPFFHPAVMLRRSFLERNDGYDAELRRAQDRDLWFRGRHNSRYANLELPLTRYRTREGISRLDLIHGTKVLTKAIRRDRLSVSHYYYPARFLVAGVLGNLGIARTGLRNSA